MLHLIWFNWVVWQDKLPDQILRMGFWSNTALCHESLAWKSREPLAKRRTIDCLVAKSWENIKWRWVQNIWMEIQNVKVKGHTGLSKTSFWNMWKEKRWYLNFECHTCSDRSRHPNLAYSNIIYQLLSL